MTFSLHERKYELDSLCAFFKLSYAYYSNSQQDISPFNSIWLKAVNEALTVIKLQQEPQGPLNPSGGSGYYFQRSAQNPTDTLMHGVGPPSKRTGLSISPFRPSDDAATLPFPTAANAMAVVSLNNLSIILNALKSNGDNIELIDRLISISNQLSNEINSAIQQHCIMNHPTFGDIYAYEIDGFGNGYFMDDANIPSLLSLPYLGYCSINDPIYQRTREFLLSDSNPYFFQGR